MNNEISDALQTQSGKRKAFALIIFAALAVSAAQFVYIFKQADSDQILTLSQALVEIQDESKVNATAISNYADLATLFPNLGFKVTVPERLVGAHYKLLTARLVQLEGVSVIQLQLINQQKQPQTLFVQPFTDEFRPLHNRRQLRHEWLVSHWYEGELFYSLLSTEK